VDYDFQIRNAITPDVWRDEFISGPIDNASPNIQYPLLGKFPVATKIISGWATITDPAREYNNRYQTKIVLQKSTKPIPMLEIRPLTMVGNIVEATNTSSPFNFTLSI